MQEWQGGIIIMKYQELSDFVVLTSDQVQQVLLHLLRIIKPKSH